ncbi:MAG: hypothetical protein ABW352_22325 [Polyangiales bacterium]
MPLGARAQAAGVVSWRAPTSCTREAFDIELQRLLGEAPPVAVSVQLSQRGGGWSTTVAIADASRTLQLASCDEARRTAALLIATAVAPERVSAVRATSVPTGLEPRAEVKREEASPAPAEPTREAPKPVEPAPVEVAPVEPAPVPSEPARVATPRVPAPRIDSDLRLRLGGQLAAFTLPEVSGGPSLGAELVRGRFVTWLDARYLIARRAVDESSDLRAELDLFTAALGTAWMAPAGPLVLGPFAELESGVLRARGQGERDARSRNAPWLAGALGLRADAHLYRRAALSLYAAASIPFWRPGVQLGDEASFHTTSPIAIRAGIVLRVAIGVARTSGRGQ